MAQAVVESDDLSVDVSVSESAEFTGVVSVSGTINASDLDKWGIDKQTIANYDVTIKDGVATVINDTIKVPVSEYTVTKNSDDTYTVAAKSTSKNYTGSKTVQAEGKAENKKPDALMISSVKVVGNKATVILSGASEGAAGYD